MKNKLIIKNWEMDYSFLIKNYLNPDMWQKTWTLFQYGRFKIDLRLYSIYVQNKELLLDIQIHYPSETGAWTFCEKSVTFSLKIKDINFLKRRINSTILDVIISMEKQFIRRTDEYLELCDAEDDERNKLEDIAREFMERNGVTNYDLVESYVDTYVDVCAVMPNKKEDYINSKIYTYFPEFYLTWLSTIEDDPSTKQRVEQIKAVLSKNNKLEQVLKDVEKYKQYMETEEFISDMENNLEEV